MNCAEQLNQTPTSPFKNFEMTRTGNRNADNIPNSTDKKIPSLALNVITDNRNADNIAHSTDEKIFSLTHCIATFIDDLMLNPQKIERPLYIDFPCRVMGLILFALYLLFLGWVAKCIDLIIIGVNAVAQKFFNKSSY